MKSYNPDELTAKVKQEQEETSDLAVEILKWFLDDNRIGELYPRKDVVQALSEHLEVDNRKASIALSSVVGDIVDPVQQVTTEQGKFVGIIDYKVYDDSGAYGYTHFDDRQLQRKRVVCAKCVEEAELDGEVVHATQGEGSSSKDASSQQLLDKVTSHYADAHTEAPEEIEPGASLVSDTTISGNTALHAGNESTIDHNSLSSRTHEGDDITPDNVTTDVDVEVGRDVSVGQNIDSISRKILFEEGPSVTNQWIMSVISGDFVIGYGDSSETFSTVSINQSEVDMSGKNLLIDTINGSQPAGGGSAIGGSVTNYSDLPFNLSERQFYYVSSEQDIVVQTDANLKIWKSISDFTTVAADIVDNGLQHLFWGPQISDISTYPDIEGGLSASSSGDPQLGLINNRQAAVYDGNDNHSVGSSLPLPSGSNDFTAVVVTDPTDNGSQQRLFDMGSTSSTTGGYEVQIEFNNSRYGIALSGQNKTVGGPLETGPQIIVATYRSSDETYAMDVNKNQKINTTDSSNGMSAPQANTIIGEGAGGIHGTEGDIGAAGHEQGFADSTRRDELTDIFANEFEISV